MEVSIDNRDIQIPVKTVIAVQYDNDTEYIDFTFDRSQQSEDISSLTPLILYRNSTGGYLDAVESKIVNDDTVIVRWKLDKHITYVAGDIEFMIVFASCEDINNYQNAERIWQTKTITCYIPETILATESFTAESPLISKLLAIATQIDEVIGDADKVLVDMAAIKDEAIQSVQDAKDTINNFTGEDVRFTDGKTFQEKYEAGELDGPPGPQGPEGAGLNILGTLVSVDLLPIFGEPGQAYLIGGDLYVWTLKENRWTNVGQVKGDPGPAPTIGDNGNWFIDNVDTGVPVNVKGDKGDIGKSAYEIAVENGFEGSLNEWLQSLVGKTGTSPTIGDNKNWFIGETDTGIKAEGNNGITPSVGENGNWFIGSLDTGVRATPLDGHSPVLSISDNGTWIIDGVDSGKEAAGTVDYTIVNTQVDNRLSERMQSVEVLPSNPDPTIWYFVQE